MKKAIVIEKGIPIPPAYRGRKRGNSRYAVLEAGDSFQGSKNEYNAARMWGRNQEPVRKFAVRVTDGVVRIWRVK